MLVRLTSLVRRSLATIAIGAVVASIATPAAAQNVQPDGRWQAWLGCWTPAGTLIRVVGKSASSVVCVVPTSTALAVDVVTVSGGKIVDRTHIDADGQPHTISKEGCTGWQSAKWSPSARRVYLKSEFNCSGAPVTHVSGVYAMAGSGEWIDVQGMRVDKNIGVHTVRYREATDDEAIPAEITRALQERTLAKMASMLAVSATPSLGDVEEASHELDPSVVSTWLIESDKLTIERPAPLNAKQLVQLADNGVPGSVIDVMVALSYPNELSVNPANNGVARQNSDSIYTQYRMFGSASALNPLIGFDRFGFPIYASESALMAGCSPFMYGPYDAGWNLYASQYGCGGRYGYGLTGYPAGYGYGGYYGAGYGGYFGGFYPGYFGGGPVVVPNQGSGGAIPPHGHVVNGRGYTTGGSGSGGTAAPRSGDVSPSTSGAAGSPPPSSPPPPPPRTAEPKKP